MGTIAGMSEQELRNLWAPWLKGDLPPDEAGWYLGWCPHHSADRSGLCDAEVNFGRMRFRCNNEGPCHNGTSISLRDPTAWISGFETYSEMRNHRAQQSSESRWAEADEAIKLLQRSHPKMEPAFLPTRRQVEAFRLLLIESEQTIDYKSQPGWWKGWCPLHDHKRSKSKPSAYYNFRTGSYVCLAPEPCHAPKKGMSLINLKARMDEAPSRA